MGLGISHLRDIDNVVTLDDYFRPPPHLLIFYQPYKPESFTLRPEKAEYHSLSFGGDHKGIVGIRGSLMGDIANLASECSNDFSNRLNRALYLCRCGFSAAVVQLHQIPQSMRIPQFDQRVLIVQLGAVQARARNELSKLTATLPRPMIMCCSSYEGRNGSKGSDAISLILVDLSKAKQFNYIYFANFYELIAALPPFFVKFQNCPNQHEMKRQSAPQDSKCPTCTVQPSDNFGCRQCNYFQCLTCGAASCQPNVSKVITDVITFLQEFFLNRLVFLSKSLPAQVDDNKNAEKIGSSSLITDMNIARGINDISSVTIDLMFETSLIKGNLTELLQVCRLMILNHLFISAGKPDPPESLANIYVDIKKLMFLSLIPDRIPKSSFAFFHDTISSFPHCFPRTLAEILKSRCELPNIPEIKVAGDIKTFFPPCFKPSAFRTSALDVDSVVTSRAGWVPSSFAGLLIISNIARLFPSWASPNLFVQVNCFIHYYN
jgi:hypothetical protein